MKAILIGGPQHGEMVEIQDGCEELHFAPGRFFRSGDLTEVVQDDVYVHRLTICGVGIFAIANASSVKHREQNTKLLLDALIRGLTEQAKQPDMRWIVQEMQRRYGPHRDADSKETDWLMEHLLYLWERKMANEKRR